MQTGKDDRKIIVVRVPPALHKALAEIAKRDGLTMNALLVTWLNQKVNHG